MISYLHWPGTNTLIIPKTGNFPCTICQAIKSSPHILCPQSWYEPFIPSPCHAQGSRLIQSRWEVGESLRKIHNNDNVTNIRPAPVLASGGLVVRTDTRWQHWLPHSAMCGPLNVCKYYCRLWKYWHFVICDHNIKNISPGVLIKGFVCMLQINTHQYTY